jgi:hypothetical protein
MTATSNDSPEMTEDILSLVGIDVPIGILQAWTEEQRREANDWASAIYMQNVFGRKVEPPPKPTFLCSFTS